jgi:hypothetical protein
MERAFTLMPPTMQRMWGLRHFGPGGELLFQHRTLAKFRFGQAPAHPDFVNEERCLEHVDRLQAKWPGFAPWRAPGNAAHEATAGSLQGSYLYAPLKGVPRRLTLRADGGLEANGEIPWNSWRPGRDESGAPGICLRATDGWNCVARWNGKCYAGCWPMRWDPPFALLKDV